MKPIWFLGLATAAALLILEVAMKTFKDLEAVSSAIVAALDRAAAREARQEAARDDKNAVAVREMMGNPAPVVRNPASLAEILGHPVS